MSQSRKRLTSQECFGNRKHIRVVRQELPSSILHSHEFFEIEIILKGKGTHIMNNKEFPLSRGMIWLSTPADFHEIILEDTAEYWTIIFDETIISTDRIQTLLQAETVCTTVSETELNRLDTVANLIYEEHLRDGYFQPLMEYLLDTLIPHNHKGLMLSPVRQAILYIETFFRNSPSLSDVASQVGLNPTYFGNLFKKETGETFINFLNRRKVTCAMMLLENNVPVSTACYEAGFGSLSGFLHTFKKIAGISPNEYRKKVAKP